MRFPALLLPLALCACGPSAERSPPLHAQSPAAAPEAELAPGSRLPDDVRPTAYQVALDLDPTRPTYTGSVTIDLDLSRPRESIWLHSRGLRVSEVRVERTGAEPLIGKLEQVGTSGLVALRLAQPVGPGAVRAHFVFEGDVGQRLTGLYGAESAGEKYLFTQFEAISAREAFPCLDEPRFKAPFTLTLRVPEAQTAVANTRMLESRTVEGGKKELHFAPTEKLPTYLIALAVGPLDVVEAPGIEASALREHPIPLRGLAVRGRGADLAFALKDTPPLLDWLEGYFGVAYPFDKLDLIAVPDFGAGAMENAGAITFRDTLLLVRSDAPEQQKRTLGYVNAHELAHQWFGDLVTMPWWDDIWLNEAFATWMGGKAVSAVHPEYEASFGALTSTHGAMEVDSRVSARQIRQPIESDHDIENAFDAITYSKGGAVLSMFERYLGTLRFQSGLRAYVERYRFGSATAKDLVRTLAEVGEEPALESAFATFLEQPGVPELQMQVDCKTTPPTLAITQRRYLPIGASAASASRWEVPVCVRFAEDKAGTKEQCALVREPTARVPLEAERCPKWLMPNADADGYYRFVLPEAELDALVAARASLSPREQMSLASNVAAAFRAGTLDAARLMRVQAGLIGVPQRHVFETVLRNYLFVRELLDDAALPAFRAELSQKLAPIAKKLAPLTRAPARERGEAKLWRASVARALFSLAEDKAATAELARAGRALIEGKPGAEALPNELHELALSAALREGGAPLIDRAVAKLHASSDGMERSRILVGLSFVRDPALRERVLELSLDPSLRLNERLVLLVGQTTMPETRRPAYAWLKTHFDALLAHVSARGGKHLIGFTAGLFTEEEARDVEQFFGPKAQAIPGGPRELALALESIRTWAALEQAAGPALRARFARRAGAPTAAR